MQTYFSILYADQDTSSKLTFTIIWQLAICNGDEGFGTQDWKNQFQQLKSNSMNAMKWI